MKAIRTAPLLLAIGVLPLPGAVEEAAAGSIPPVQAWAVGDFDGDGIPDVAVGMPEVSKGAGEVRILSGKNGKTLLKLKGKKEAAFGEALAAVGDTDKDGAEDLAVGGSGGEDALVQVFSGKTGKELKWSKGEGVASTFGDELCAVMGKPGTDAVVLIVRDGLAGKWQPEDPARNTRSPGVKDPAGLVASTTAVGDIDGDSYGDFAISDFSETVDGKGSAGRIRVLSTLKVMQGDRKPDLLVLRGTGENECLGLSLAAAGDWDGDGTGDLLTGTSGLGSPTGAWSVRVLSGKDGKELWKAEGPKDDFSLAGLALAGDVDGDGKADVAVGNPGRERMAGRVAVLSGKDGSILWTVEGKGGEKVGDAILPLPDADGDGFPDLCVFAPGKTAGYIRYLSGKTGKEILRINPLR